MQLEVRSLGRTGIRARAMGLGCATFGHARPDYSDDEAIAAIRHAVDLGLDFVDTSAAYGESERRVGLALAGGYRDRVHLQTKAGTHATRRHDYSAEAARWSVENSLRLLKTDHLDSILIHDPTDIEDPLGAGRMLDELCRMKERGLFRYVGLGVRSHDFLCRAMETGKIDIVLSHSDYTLLSQTAADRVLPLARERGVGVILGSILASGPLAGPEPKNNVLAHEMWSWCRERGVSIRHLAIQFCLALEMDGIVLPGPRTVAEVDDAYQAATTPVADEVWAAFRERFGVGV